jgi:3-deoxy-manno-octulosonate cytidylyltransferase (CMP-KDO synthetase)
VKAIGIVPVRLESTRLPEKALKDICGLPMIVHTALRASMSKSLSEVYVATDNKKIRSIVESYGIKVIMTSKDHKNSSERAAEACQDLEADIVVNIQGDEPLLYPEHIDKITQPILEDDSIQVCLGISKFYKFNSYSDLKAAIDLQGNLLFSSRNDIPYYYLKDNLHLWKLCFIVPHRKDVLLKYLEWKQTPLELIEDNHFLRLLEHGVPIRTFEVNQAKISVDTQEDLEEVRLLMEKDKIMDKYKND